MIKIFPDSLDQNCPHPHGSEYFVDDLTTYSPDFERASNAEQADVILIPQFSNYVHAPYLFDREKADRYAQLKKPIVMHNDGGGIVDGWKRSEVGEYIWGPWADLVKVFFSVECYNWHRRIMPPNVRYMPFDFIGYVRMGIGLRPVFPLQTKDRYLNRPLGTAVAMNQYPPTRDILWDLLHEENWPHFSHRTHLDAQTRISGEAMWEAILSAKIGFAPDGATAKTERHVVVANMAAMMMQDDTVEFPFEWADGVNCLKMVHDLIPGYEMERIDEYEINGHDIRVLNKEATKAKVLDWLSRPDDLYEVYKAGWYNDQNYQLPNYHRNYIGPTIKNAL